MATASHGNLWENPLGTDGFEFIEYAAPDPLAMGRLFEQMGFTAVARHRAKNVLLYRQGNVNFIVNAEPNSFAQSFARVHVATAARRGVGNIVRDTRRRVGRYVCSQGRPSLRQPPTKPR